jgi:hypothetical protein
MFPSVLIEYVHIFSSRHIIYAPAKNNKYAASGFPTIADAMTTNNEKVIQEQVAIVTYFVRGALSTLNGFDRFISK